MQKILITVAVLLLCSAHSPAQNFLTLGMNLSAEFFDNPDLEKFTQTYNQVNANYMVRALKGMRSVFGVQAEVGYRHLGKRGYALEFGYQTGMREDYAQFGNGDIRRLELRITSWNLGGELEMFRWTDVSINALLIGSFFRHTTIRSSYDGVYSGGVVIPLNGNYQGSGGFLTRLGVGMSVLRKPIFLIARISYPIFAAGTVEELRDNNPEKVANGTTKFPRDYREYLLLGNYRGVSAEMSGLQFSITVALAFQLKKK